MDQGLERAGFTPIWMCEIDRQCREVLRFHYPTLPIYQDMLALDVSKLDRPDVFCGGTPCQGFSVAGLRKSLDDDRSNLCLQFVKLCNELDPSIILWENVPGCLSTADNAFGCFLAGLVGADAPLVPPDSIRRWKTGKSGRYFSWTDAGMVVGPRRTACWRTCDSQFFGVAQRRQRVFVVCDTGDRSAAQILFESKSVRGHHPPGEETREGITGTLGIRATGGGGLGTDFDLAGGLQVTGTLDSSGSCRHAHGQGNSADFLILHCIAGAVSSKWAKGTGGPAGDECYNLIAHTLKGEGFDASEDGTGRRTPIIAFDTTQITSKANYSNPKDGDPCHPLASGAHAPAIAYRTSGNCGLFEQGDKTATLNTATDPNQTIIAFTQNASGDALAGDVSCAVSTNPNASGRNNAEVCQPVAIRTAQTSSNGCGIDESGTSYTLDGAQGQAVGSKYGVRRLMPIECERLQGYPDGWTLNAISESDGKPYQQADSPRYKQCGNGVTASVAEWLGRRIVSFFARNVS